MRDEFRCKMREDIDLLGSLIDALDGLHEQAEAEFDSIEQAEEEGLELFPMMGVGRCISSARSAWPLTRISRKSTARRRPMAEQRKRNEARGGEVAG